MKVVVIGAGAGGLATARRFKEGKQFEFVVYEQSNQIGGTWVYVENTGEDEFGLPIHSSMYKNLRTNLPKEVMGYPDYPIPCEDGRSYLRAEEILKFINDFADHYELRQHIKLRHCVRSVEPSDQGDKKWRITVEDLINKRTEVTYVDAVAVCNGHYNTPYVPKYKNHEKFKYRIMHSHNYRTPDIFNGECVVVVGAGPSGMDIALDISPNAKTVVLSHYSKEPITVQFPSNVIQKPEISSYTEREVNFVDGSSVKADTVFFCTGYDYVFPFLSEKCGVKVKNNCVTPVYKHLISVENPTICFIGLPYYVCAFSMCDLQARFFIKYLDGELKLPSKQEMLADEAADMQEREERGLHGRQSHLMGPQQQDYYDQLATMAKIENIPVAMSNLHNESSRKFVLDLVHYRNDRYRLISNDEFVLIN